MFIYDDSKLKNSRNDAQLCYQAGMLQYLQSQHQIMHVAHEGLTLPPREALLYKYSSRISIFRISNMAVTEAHLLPHRFVEFPLNPPGLLYPRPISPSPHKINYSNSPTLQPNFIETKCLIKICNTNKGRSASFYHLL